MNERVRLTWEEAERGVQPPPFTRAEWDAMNRAVDEYANRVFRLRWWSAFDMTPHETD
jgi:hypothetical protein